MIKYTMKLFQNCYLDREDEEYALKTGGYKPYLKSADILVFYTLLSLIDSETNKCEPSQTQLAEYTRLSMVTIRNSIKKLVKLEIVKIEKRKGYNVYNMNEFIKGVKDWQKIEAGDFNV